MSQKKYIVSLTEEERSQLQVIVKKLRGTSQKVKRARILLKADESCGMGWTDTKIAEACDCTTKTVENIRQRFVEEGFDKTLHGKKRTEPPVAKLLDGNQEAQIIAPRLGNPPKGYGKWSLRLLARRVVELRIADTVSYQTVRRAIKKQNEHKTSDSVLGDSSRS